MIKKQNKTLQKISIVGTNLNIIKAIYDKPTANTILKTESISPNESAHSQSLTTTFIVLKVITTATEKKKKRNPDLEKMK